MATARLRRRSAVVVCTVCAVGAALLSAANPAAATSPANDGIANAQAIPLSAGSPTFSTDVSNAGATGIEGADAALFTTDNAVHTLWYKFNPAPGLVSVTVSSIDQSDIVGGVVTSSSDDAGLDGNNDAFAVIADGSVKNTDLAEGGSTLASTTLVGEQETFSFSVDAHFVPDAQHDYYLGVGTVGEDDSVPAGTISISVTYTPAPANDDFANAAPLAASTATYSGDTTAATPDLDDFDNNADPVVGQQAGMFSVWYKFLAPRNGRAHFTTTGSAFPVVWEVCQSAVPSAQDCGQHDLADSSGGTTPKASGVFDAIKGETYYVFLDGQLVDGVNYNASGLYDLNFGFAKGPANDDVSKPTVLKATGVDRVTGTNVGAQAVVLGSNPPSTVTKERAHGLSFNHGQKHSVFFDYKPAKSGRVLLYTSGALNTDVEIFRGSLAAGYTDTGQGNDNYSSHRAFSRFEFPVRAGVAYLIAVDGSAKAGYPEGTFGLTLGAVPANDNLSRAHLLAKTKAKVGNKSKTVSKGKGKVSGSTEFAAFQTGEKSPKGFSGGADVWYTFVAPKEGTYTFTEALHGASALLAAYTGKGSNNLGLKLVKDANHAGTKKPATITLKAKAGQKFEISVDGGLGAFGAYRLTWK